MYAGSNDHNRKNAPGSVKSGPAPKADCTITIKEDDLLQMYVTLIPIYSITAQTLSSLHTFIFNTHSITFNTILIL